MLDDESLSKEADQILAIISSLEIPGALEQRVLERLRHAQPEQCSRKSKRSLEWMLPAVTVAVFCSMVISKELRHEFSSADRPLQEGTALLCSPLVSTPSIARARQTSILTRGRNGNRDADAIHKVSSTTLTSFVTDEHPGRVAPSQPEQPRMVGHIAAIRTAQTPGERLPDFSEASTPGRAMSRDLIANAPGTPLVHFSGLIADGELL